MQILALSLVGGVLFLTGLAVLVISLRSFNFDQVARRLDEYVSEPGEEAQRVSAAFSVRRSELAGSLGARTLVPWFKGLGRIFGRLTPASVMEDLERQLAIAGNPLRLGAREFYGLRLFANLLGFVLAFLILDKRGFSQNNLLLAAMILLVCTYLPKAWLKRMVGRRQERIRRGLPDALDMLSVCAEAGLGFDQSLLRVSQYWQTPLGIELGRVVSEMELGLSRRAALRSLSDRLDVSELSSFVAVILQSEQLGMSIAETLHIQAKQMREERRFRAQEAARKVPLKMLFPMLLLILPATFAVVLGPAIPILMDMFANLGNNLP